VVLRTISTGLLCSSIFLINLYFSCNRCLCWIRKRRKLLLKQPIQREQEEIVGRWKRLCLSYLNDNLIGVYETSYKKPTNLKYVLWVVLLLKFRFLEYLHFNKLKSQISMQNELQPQKFVAYNEYAYVVNARTCPI